MRVLPWLTLLALLAGCGPRFVPLGFGSDECTFDLDCAAGEACEATVCVPTCAANRDCDGGEVCAPGKNTELNVCQAERTNNQANNATSAYYAVMIRSTTTAPDACFTDEPGPDIFGVALESSTGELLGWGVLEHDAIQAGGNANAEPSILERDGTALTLDGCPATFTGNVVSLGCDDSYIVVSFIDTNSEPVALNATDDAVLRVYEWGEQCTPGTIEDTYTVSICRASAAAADGDVTSCDIEVVASSSGETSAVVGGF